MSFVSKSKVVSTLFIGAVLAGCSTTSSLKTDSSEDAEVLGGDSGVQTFALEDAGITAGNKFVMVNGQFDEYTQAYWNDISRVFYFDYDQSRLKPKDLEDLKAIVDFMQSFPELTVRIEGHADERGTREYNIALGERRAQAVQLMMKANGMTNPFEIVSYGEEKPADWGHTETSWSQNRRAEVTIAR